MSDFWLTEWQEWQDLRGFYYLPYMQRNAENLATLATLATLSWCEQNNERPVNQRAFGMRLTERGFEIQRGTAGQHWWIGIGLADSSSE